MRPNLKGAGWVPGRLGQCPKVDRIFILTASLICIVMLWTNSVFFDPTLDISLYFGLLSLIHKSEVWGKTICYFVPIFMTSLLQNVKIVCKLIKFADNLSQSRSL